MTARSILLTVLSLIICVSSERWSRQITNSDVRPEEINDWVPLTHSNDRTKNARVLNYPQNQFFQALFNSNPPPPPPPPPSVDSSHFQQRYVIPSNEQTNQNLRSQSPTSQSFFKFEMPSYSKDGVKQNNLPAVQTGYQIQHSFPHQAVVTSPLFSQKPVFPTDFYPQYQPLINQKILQQNVIEDGKRPVKDKSQELKSTKLIEATTPLPSTSFPVHSNFQAQKPTSFQAKYPFQSQGQQLSLPTSQEEEVQLLYVPYDTLYRQRNEPYILDNKYRAVPPPVNPSQINNFYTPEPLTNIDPNLFNPTPSTTTSTTYKPSTTFNAFLNPHFTTSPKPKPKLKPHQPPLAMFALKTGNRPQASVNEVLRNLINAKTIAVLDTPTQTAPQIFIGPAGLPTPHGFAKYELPYLSSIDRNHLESRLQELPFFVAPLSYKAPFGFNKITLPEPHVGSIIVNKPFPVPETNVIQQQELRTSTHRPQYQKPQLQQQVPTKQVYITPTEDTSNGYENTTPRITASSPARYRYQFGTEVSSTTNGYLNEQYQDIQSITSPKPPTRIQNIQKTRPHFQQKRPEERYQSQTIRPYSNFKPMPNHVVNEEYFKVNPVTSSSTSTTTSTTTATTTTEFNPSNRQHLGESLPSSSPLEDQTIRSNQIYNDVSSPQPEITKQRYNSRPNQYTGPFSNEEYRMKSYFREQEAFKNRPKVQNPTVDGTVYENIQYTPVSLDYEHQQLYSIPSSTPSYFEGSTLRTTTPKERITFYTPTPQNQEIKSIKQSNEAIQYNHEDGNRPSQTEQPIRTTSTHRYHDTPENPLRDDNIPSNHRPTYSNEVTYSHDTKLQEDDQEVEYEPNPYKLPTELPPLTPNLPGLVNALIEKDRLNAIEKENLTTEITPTTTPSGSYQPTRRPIHRIKKPTIKVSSSTSVSYSSSSDNGRRTVTRGRRPYNPRNNNQTSSSSSSSSPSVVTTTTTTTARSPTIRNPNRIRYNPTPEERRRYRPRIRASLPNTSKVNKDEEDNLDYQRDVLKQNYPIFKPSRKGSTATTTTTTSTERVTDSQNVVTVTPSNDKSEFASLLEPMQIAQEYQQSPNYGPGYFPNAEEASSTEVIEMEKNEIHPVYAGTTTTTTEQPVETTRRSAFIRRPSRPIRTTTESPSQTTTGANEERYTVRPRVRPDNSHRPRVVKIRARTRKPHPASTTTTTGPERRSHDTGYHQLSRFNQDFFQDDQNDEIHDQRNQQKSKFNLETQESKWSPSLSHVDSFRPVDPEDKAKFLKENRKFENEPEIVTAGPEPNYSESNGKPNTFLFNVSAGFGSSGTVYGSKNELKTANVQNNSSETSFADLLEEVMSDIGRNQKKQQTDELKTHHPVKNENRRTEVKPLSSNRRGVWRRVKVHPTDSFETAESQNLGNQIYNSIFAINKQTKLNENKMNHNIIETTDNILALPTSTEISNDNDDVTTIIPSDAPSETEQPTIQTKLHEKSQNNDNITKDATTTVAAIVKSNNGKLTTDLKTSTSNYEDYMSAAETETATDMITRRSDQEDSNNDSEDLDGQPSLFDEVKKQLTDLFAIEEEDDTDIVKPNFRPRKQEYTSIQRIRTVTENSENKNNNKEDEKEEEKVNNDNKKDTEINIKGELSPTITTTTTQTSPFHKNLMKNVIYATSTSTEISHETEICYRGRCVKAAKHL